MDVKIELKLLPVPFKKYIFLKIIYQLDLILYNIIYVNFIYLIATCNVKIKCLIKFYEIFTLCYTNIFANTRIDNIR